MSFDRFKNLLAQAMRFQQVAEGEDRRLILDPVADQVDAREPAHGGHLDQGLFHCRIARLIPVMNWDPSSTGLTR